MDQVVAQQRTKEVQLQVTRAAAKVTPVQASVNLAPGEVALYSTTMTGYQLRSGFRRSTTNYLGIRNPILKQAMGYWGVANRASGPASDQYISVGVGEFVITDQRLIFFGSQGDMTFGLSDVGQIQLANGLIIKPNGFIVHLTNQAKPVKFSGSDAIGTYDAATALQTATYLLTVNPSQLLKTLENQP